MRTPTLLVIVSLVAPLSACTLDIKQHCIGDCTPLTGGSGDPGDSGGDPTAGEDLGGEIGSCEIVDNLSLSATCGDGVVQPGELCFLGVLGHGGAQFTSALALPLDDQHGSDLLLTLADDTVRAELFAPLTSDSQLWPPLVPSPVLRATGDLDKDDIVDVVATTRTLDEGLQVRALLLDGQGGIAESKLIAEVEGAITLDVVDWNRDTHSDIVIITTAAPDVDNLLVLLGDSTGEFTATTGPRIPQPSPGYVLGWLDEDRTADDFVFIANGSARIVRNLDGAQQHTAPGMPAELWFHDFLINDFDGNGFGDLAGVATNTEFDSSELVVFLQENGEFGEPARYPVHCGARVLAWGDLDGDGVADIVTATNEGPATFRRGDLGGGFAGVMMVPLDQLEEGDFFQLADMEGDGSLDLVGLNRQTGWLSFAANRP